MRLSEAQQEFAYHVGCLLLHIHARPGYSCTIGDAYRDPRVHGSQGQKLSYSAAVSDHKIRLAIDLNLFKDGVYQDDSDAHAEFGAYWEALHPKNYWGVRSASGEQKDGNHYGRKWG